MGQKSSNTQKITGSANNKNDKSSKSKTKNVDSIHHNNIDNTTNNKAIVSQKKESS